MMAAEPAFTLIVAQKDHQEWFSKSHLSIDFSEGKVDGVKQRATHPSSLQHGWSK